MKQITFSYNGKQYTLEFTREIVRNMQRRGFLLDEIDTKPAVVIPDLFAGAFLKNHPTVRREKIDEIYTNMRDKRGLLEALIELYNEPQNALMDDEEDSGNCEWTQNWEKKEET